MMHCTHPKDPSPPVTPEPSIWSLYLDSSSLQWAVNRWPKDAATERFFLMLYSESTEKVKILNDTSAALGSNLRFEVHGRVYGKSPAAFSYELNPKDLTYPEKDRLLAFLKGHYVHEKTRGYPTFRRVCKALGMAFK